MANLANKTRTKSASPKRSRSEAVQRTKELAAQEAQKKQLDAKAKSIGSLLARARSADFAARYQVGIEVKEVERDEKRYGTRAVERLGELLKVAKTVLYEHAIVRETWSWPQVQGLAKKKNEETHFTLTWSHLVVIATVKDRARRSQLVASAIAESLSVRELKGRVHGQDPGPNVEEDTTVAPPHLKVAATQIVPIAENYLSRSAIWERSLFERIETARDDDLDKPLLATLARAKAVHEEMQKACATNLARIERALKRVESVVARRTAPPAPQSAADGMVAAP